MMAADLKGDLELIRQARCGHRAAFDMLVVKYQHRLYNLFRRYLHDQTEIADLTQETFIKAFRALDSFREDSLFYTWLYRIAINTMKNYLEAKQRDEEIIIEPPADYLDELIENELADDATPEGLLARDRLAKVVFNAVNVLPYDLRTAIILRELEGLSYDEIAGIMDCPLGTVRSRIARARDLVNKNLMQADGKTIEDFLHP